VCALNGDNSRANTSMSLKTLRCSSIDLAALNDESSRAKVQNVREDSSR
jgi:hypothetical protein